MQLIDSHSHVDGREFDADRQDVLRRARTAGVSTILAVGTGASLDQVERALLLARKEPDVLATVGIHPHDAARFAGSDWPNLLEMAKDARFVAVGETGLDFHYDHSPREVQVDVFRRQVRMALELGKPVVCHVRDAHSLALQVLVEERASQAGVAIHCFTGGPGDAAAYVAAGCYVSFSGIVTFKGKSADPIREAIREVPLDRLLIETDCPYLAPVPMRGKRNEPAYLGYIAEAVAASAGIAVADLAAATVANTRRLFRLTGPT
ncbi:MAG: TatD family hydrolase [Deltaproteobacteria bacterium]|nr:TatD family hydrolase [Deltaproteobacteria bacterium]